MKTITWHLARKIVFNIRQISEADGVLGAWLDLFVTGGEQMEQDLCDLSGPGPSDSAPSHGERPEIRPLAPLFGKGEIRHDSWSPSP